MSNKIFYGFVALLVLGTIGFVVIKNQSKPEVPRPGIEQADHGRKHVASKQYGEGEPPTSGDHASPIAWQVYQQEVSDDAVIHNMEHGGVYISYSSSLPADQVAKITAIFGAPFSRKGFSPSKAVVAPRTANDAPIIMSSWNRNEKLETFDEEKLVQYYLKNIGKSPEPTAS